MKDIQNLPDARRIPIDKVGVKDIRYPITVLDKVREEQQTVASINMYVNLPHQFKGTHMSRFVEILDEYRNRFNTRDIPAVLEEMKKRLHAESAHLEITFPFFMTRQPTQETVGRRREYRCSVMGSVNVVTDIVLEVAFPLESPWLLPRKTTHLRPERWRGWQGELLVAVRYRDWVWIEDLVGVVEEAAARNRERGEQLEEAQLDALQWAGMLVRAVNDQLRKDDNITWRCVRIVNPEPTRTFGVHACIEQPRQPRS